MKVKGFKSAIHNFAHSFQSIDICKSPKYAVNILIDLHNKQVETKVTFDFLKKNIEPKIAVTKSSQRLLSDYCDWLPIHCGNHNCDANDLEMLQTELWADFETSFSPPNMGEMIQLDVCTHTRWKIKNREERAFKICQSEVISKGFLKKGIPEPN